MRALTGAVAGAVVAAGLIIFPSQTSSAATIDQVCAHVFVSPLDAQAAATVRTVNAAGRPTTVGRAAADRVISRLVSGVPGSTCTKPRSDSAQGIAEAVEFDIADGNREAAIAYLRESIAGLTFTPSTRSVVGPRAKLPNPDAAKCEEFAASTLLPPEAYEDAIALALLAQTVGDAAVAAEGADKARSIVESWAESNADGQATTVADWMTVLAYLQEAGASQFHLDLAMTQARAIAQDGFARYNRSECRTTAKDIECLLKAVMVLKALGAEPAGANAAVVNGLRAWREGVGKGKRAKCPLERYEFRMTYTEQGGQRGFSKFDTGLVTFEVANGRITSKDKGPLIITGGTGGCWVQDDNGTWQRVGDGTIKGGSYPYRVSGVDRGEDFLLRLRPPAQVTGTFTGAPECQALGELGLSFANSVLGTFGTPGFELPAGAFNIDDSIVSREVFEPTGEVVVGTLSYTYRMVYPRR